MQIEIIGKLIKLVSVNTDDSKFISELRSTPVLNQFLSSTNSIDENQQKKWLDEYLNLNDGHYFLIKDKLTNEPTGTISIYDLDKSKMMAEFGRYICINPMHSIEAELLLIEFSFKVMMLKEIYCRTAMLNEKVWNQHYKFGFKDNGSETLEERNMILKKQKLTDFDFSNFDYSKLCKLIEKFSLK